MRLDQLVNSIIYGELAGDQLSSHLKVPSNPGTDMLFIAIEAALTALYVKFPLKYSSRYIQLVPGTSVYNLAASQVAAFPDIFLTEVGPEAFPVTDNIASILDVSSMPVLPTYPDEEDLSVVPFNVGNEPLAVTTIDPLVLRVPDVYTDASLILRIDYRALPAVLPRHADLVDADLSGYWLDIGYQFQDAIIAYTTYKLFSSLDVADAVSLSRRALKRYEGETIRLLNEGSFLMQTKVEEGIQDGGWA